ncbi:NAD kinase [Aquabacterium sp. A08]|uniref:NAD kinase n=1 Tax=Aquabacterium sp. A08 TaxID=2718532 RepID=UPI00142134EF|nr:NAD kinase [Aquabacterium sp. A08]NIC42167.1 NAD kinase [Aquabacterium sp. A08]
MNLPPAPPPPAPARPGSSRFRHVAIVGKYHAVGSRDALERIAHFLHDQGCEVAIEHDTAHNTGLTHYHVLDVAGIGRECDLALVMGGDGTMLGIARQLARHKVPLVGINQGRLGFITDIPFLDFETHLQPILRGQYEEDRRALMQAGVLRDGRYVFETIAMNDVVVNRGVSPGMVELRVEVDGHFVANQRADGLIIASPTGSTAYALSAGGPLLHPAIDGWIMAPIAPHTLSNRPIVLPATGEIAVEIVAGRDASAHFDMQTFTSLLHGDRITVRRSVHELCLLHPVGWSYFDTLRKKLHWNEGVVT